MRLQGSGQRSAERACCAPICMRKGWVCCLSDLKGRQQPTRVNQAGTIICGLPSVRAVGPCVTANAGPSAPMVRSGSRRSGESAPLAKDPARYKVPDPAAAPFFPQHPVCLGFLGTASVPEHSVAPDRLLCTLGHPTAQASVPVPHPPATPNSCRAPPLSLAD